jgi:hypothetical protein
MMGIRATAPSEYVIRVPLAGAFIELFAAPSSPGARATDRLEDQVWTSLFS